MIRTPALSRKSHPLPPPPHPPPQQPHRPLPSPAFPTLVSKLGFVMRSFLMRPGFRCHLVPDVQFLMHAQFLILLLI